MADDDRRRFPEDAAAAARVVAAWLRPTPLVRVDHGPDSSALYLKLETLQPTGSFKVRGALAAAAAGSSGAPMVTASAGNHGLGVAFAADRLGLQATVVVPTSAPAPKIDGIRRFRVDLRVQGATYEEAEAAAIALAEETGGRFVSAYSDPHVIAGQSTILTELADSLPGGFQVVVPVGGGRLAAGMALGASLLRRDSLDGGITVVGVEAAASPAVSAAVAAGRIVDVPVAPTLADGLAGNLDPTAITPAILRAAGVALLAVTEDEIVAGIRQLATRHGIIAEGSAAVGMAAALSGLLDLSRPTVLVVTGRNIALDRLIRVLAAG